MTPPDPTAAERAARLDLVEGVVGAVSHDFNNVLAAVSMYAEFVLTEGGLNGQAEQDVEEILAAARRGAAMTAFLGVLTGTREPVAEPLELGTELAHVHKLFTRLLPDGVTLGVAETPTPVEVVGDRAELQRRMFTLVWQAAGRLGPEGGELDVEVEVAAGEARIHVDGGGERETLVLASRPDAPDAS